MYLLAYVLFAILFTHNIFHTYEKIDTEEVPEKVKKNTTFYIYKIQ